MVNISIGKVRFLIFGSQKSGTTALYRYFKSYPQLVMPDVKDYFQRAVTTGVYFPFMDMFIAQCYRTLSFNVEAEFFF